MAKSASMKQEKGNKLQWFFFVVVIPVVFLITLALITFTLMGVNVFEQAEKYANKVPGLSSVVSTSEEEASMRETDELQATIANSKAEVEQLQQEVDSKQATIDELKQQVTQLEADLESADEGEENESDKVADLASSFQEMDPEEAAPIIEQMNEPLAVQVLEKVPNEERGNILGQMDPEIAAGIASSILGAPSE